MPRRSFIIKSAVAATLAVGSVLHAQAARPTQPNIIVIVADDLGYHDLGVQGATDIPTPHIDSLAKQGVRFTNGYVTAPVCSPTRAALLTGRYQQRHGHDLQPGRNDGLWKGESTLAEDLKRVGYATGAVGKWNLGVLDEFHPQQRGFDEFFGFLPAVHDYLADPPGGARRAGRADQPSAGPGKLLRGTETVDEPAYLTDAFGREAVAFIDRHHQQPYFLYLAFNAVHNPLQATDKYLARFPNLTGPRKTYAAMLSAMDDAVGEVLAKVEQTGDEKETLVVFVSDNGGPSGSPGNGSDNTPLRGRKSTVWEGGVRIPFFAKWPAKFPAGAANDVPVIALDIYPTALAAAGGNLASQKQADGIDLLPIATAKPTPQQLERPLFWRFDGQWAVRKGQWKLTSADGTAYGLYDLSTDVAESNDVAGQHPDVVAQLGQAWKQWDAGNSAPRWQESERKQNRKRRDED